MSSNITDNEVALTLAQELEAPFVWEKNGRLLRDWASTNCSDVFFYIDKWTVKLRFIKQRISSMQKIVKDIKYNVGEQKLKGTYETAGIIELIAFQKQIFVKALKIFVIAFRRSSNIS